MPLHLRTVLRRLLPEDVRLERSEGRYVGLLLSVLVPVLLLPVTASIGDKGIVLQSLVFSQLLIQCLYTLSRTGDLLHSGLRRNGYVLLGLVSLVGIWIPALHDGWRSLHFQQLVLILLSLFFIYSSVRLVRRLARAPRVNALVMAGAAAGYMLLGFTGGVVATATERLAPGSFRLDAVLDQEQLLDRLTYFSYVTIAGLGPGDIVASSAVGERFVILLSVCGTLYVALLVGLLLGRFIASQEVAYLEEEQQSLPRRLPERE